MGHLQTPNLRCVPCGSTLSYQRMMLLLLYGGPVEGATVVHQEDNAPPHQEGDFHAWLTREFETRGWRLEPQAPQGPYTNVLDLQVPTYYLTLTFVLTGLITIELTLNLTLTLPPTLTCV